MTIKLQCWGSITYPINTINGALFLPLTSMVGTVPTNEPQQWCTTPYTDTNDGALFQWHQRLGIGTIPLLNTNEG